MVRTSVENEDELLGIVAYISGPVGRIDSSYRRCLFAFNLRLGHCERHFLIQVVAVKLSFRRRFNTAAAQLLRRGTRRAYRKSV